MFQVNWISNRISVMQTRRNATEKEASMWNTFVFICTWVWKNACMKFFHWICFLLNWICWLGFFFVSSNTNFIEHPPPLAPSPQFQTTREINQIAISKEQIAVLFTGYKNFTTFRILIGCIFCAMLISMNSLGSVFSLYVQCTHSVHSDDNYNPKISSVIPLKWTVSRSNQLVFALDHSCSIHCNNKPILVCFVAHTKNDTGQLAL